MKRTIPEDVINCGLCKGEEIPIIIGVSAHRNIKKVYHRQIKDIIINTFEETKQLCPHSPIVMLNGLAEGGDQLCAEVAIETGVKIYAVLPDEESAYVNTDDFTQEGINKYKEIINNQACLGKYVAPDMEKTGPEHVGNEIVLQTGEVKSLTAEEMDELQKQFNRDYRFRQQTIYVATQCHFLLALWNGKPASGSKYDCGTAAAVNFNLEHKYNRTRDGKLNSYLGGAVIAITSPRESDFNTAEVEIERTFIMSDANNPENKMPPALKEKLIRTDLFNKDFKSKKKQ